MEPKIMSKGELLIAGVSGDASETGQLWQRFSELDKKVGLKNCLSRHGYEVRLHYQDGQAKVHVGVCVADSNVDGAFTVLRLPASTYAVWEVYVARGYDSANADMDRWLEANRARYGERKLDGAHYAVEHYDERFKGDSEDSVVEIWIPLVELG